MAAYYIYHHVVLSSKFVDNIESFDGRDWIEGLGELKRLKGLERAQPRDQPVPGWIVVSNDVCEDCKDFFLYIEEVLGIYFEVETCRAMWGEHSIFE